MFQDAAFLLRAERQLWRWRNRQIRRCPSKIVESSQANTQFGSATVSRSAYTLTPFSAIPPDPPAIPYITGHQCTLATGGGYLSGVDAVFGPVRRSIGIALTLCAFSLKRKPNFRKQEPAAVRLDNIALSV